MALYTYIVFATLIASVYSKVANLHSCNNNVTVCEVTEVRIEPCADPKACKFKKNINASIEFDFVPYFSASNLKTIVFWDQGVSEIPLQDLDQDSACQLTKCPTESGTPQTLTYSMPIRKKYPKGNYLLKWLVWDAADNQQVCCFKTNIKIVK